MIHLSLEYKFSVEPASRQLENSLLKLLETLHANGSIAGAAEDLGRSYRHVWGQLKHWEKVLNTQLVIWGRNSHGAALTSEALDFLQAMRESEKELESLTLKIKTKLMRNTKLLQR